MAWAELENAFLKLTGVPRHTIAWHRMRIERDLLAAVGRPRRRAGGRILAYHTVGQPDWGTNDVSPERFRRQITQALELGYRFGAERRHAVSLLLSHVSNAGIYERNEGMDTIAARYGIRF